MTNEQAAERLRTLATAAMASMTCGGHQSTGSLMRCQECTDRSNAAVDLRRALDPDVVLALLDRLEPMPPTQEHSPEQAPTEREGAES